MRIATWNVNSINRRQELVGHWLEDVRPDILCIQETKCTAEKFPSFEQFGYQAAVLGDGAWNGVAILSRIGLADVTEQLQDPPKWEGRVEPRAIGASCGPLRVWSLYIPNGRDLAHDHYRYKLEWLESLRRTARAEQGLHPNLMLLGDFNVIPTDDDVYDITKFRGHTHVSDPERRALRELQHTGLTEILPRPLKYDRAYTYWDYRQLAFPKNRGMRIDLVYATPQVADTVTDAYSDREARKGKGTSDHAPVVVDLDLPVG